MNEWAVPIAATLCICTPSILLYVLASRWLAAREQVDGLATRGELAAVHKQVEGARIAVSNLAAEMDSKLAELRSQQVGLIAGMGDHPGRMRNFR